MAKARSNRSRVAKLVAVFGAVAFFMLGLVASPLAPAQAAPNPQPGPLVDVTRVDQNVRGSITLSYREDGETNPLSGVKAQAFCIANIDLGYSPVDRFASLLRQVGWSQAVVPQANREFTHEDWDKLAATVAEYVAADGMNPDFSGISDASGDVTFTDLKPCIYLVVTDSFVTSDQMVRYTFKPLLTSVPSATEDGNFTYETKAVPKFQTEVIGHPKDYKVVKLWNDAAIRQSRPTKVALEIYQDDELWQRVDLSQDNNWMFAWTDPAGVHTYRVVERDIPDSYTVTNEVSGTTFKIINAGPDSHKPWPKTGFDGFNRLFFGGVTLSELGVFLVLVVGALLWAAGGGRLLSRSERGQRK